MPCRLYSLGIHKNLQMNQSLMNIKELLQNIFLSYVLLWDPLGWNLCLVNVKLLNAWCSSVKHSCILSYSQSTG